MKKIFSLLICFYSVNSFCQKMDRIIDSDTIYIYFESSEIQSIKVANKHDLDPLKDIKNYEIKFDKENFINISERKYLDLDRLDINKVSEKKIVSKKFLKENKDIIINIKFIKKMGLKEIYFKTYGKVLYLIDKDEIKCGKLLLKEVVYGRVSYIFNE